MYTSSHPFLNMFIEKGCVTMVVLVLEVLVLERRKMRQEIKKVTKQQRVNLARQLLVFSLK